MATIKRKIKVRNGAAASRPTLATGELGLDTDTGSECLYIGTPAGNFPVATLGTVSASVATASTHKVKVVIGGATYYLLVTT